MRPKPKQPDPAETPQTDRTQRRRYMRPREVAEYTGISSSTLAKLRCWGRGPRYSKPSARKVLYDQMDVDDWLEELKRGSTLD